MKILKNILIAIAVLIITLLIGLSFMKPSNDRDWSPDQTTLSYAEVEDNLVHVKNIRNFTYRSTTDYDIDYYDKTFDFDNIKSVYYIVEPFSDFAGAAHTFLSFEFENDEFLSISVEIRKEKGESFSAIKGLFNQYELSYVFGDERDLVKLRSNYRKDLVYVYPTTATKERTRELFLDMVERANKLKDEPEFYNSLFNTCTTNIVSHVNNFAQDKIKWNYKVLFPGYSDQYAYDLGIYDTDLSFEDAKKEFLINDLAEEFADDPDFSLKIRRR